jgi:hypothetical protein
MQELMSYGSDNSSDESPEPSAKRQHMRMAKKQCQHLPGPDAIFNADPASIDSLIGTARGPESNGGVPEWKRPRQDGRVLSFAPSPGTHALLVYIPVSLPQMLMSELTTLISVLRSKLKGLTLHPLIADLEPDKASGEDPSTSHPSPLLHISLSRTQPIKFHLVESLLQELKCRIAEAVAVMSDSLPARVNLCSATSFANDKKTCSFASIAVGDVDGSRDFIYSIIVAVNHVLTMHGLQSYYRSPQLHVSFAWAAGDHKEELGLALRDSDLSFTPTSVPIESIVCRIGKIDHQVISLEGPIVVRIG